jgi:hypothetical protein
MSNDKLPTVPPPPKKKGKLPPVQLPPVANGQLPVVAKAKRPLRALKDFAEKAEDLKEYFDSVRKNRNLLDTACKYPWSADAPEALDKAGKVLGLYDGLYHELAKELEIDLEKFNPEDAYDDDGNITEDVVRKHLALLLASFPNANPGNAEAYSGMMVEEVMAEYPTLVALESACSQIRRTSKFPPTTAEVIEAIQEHGELWSERLSAIYYGQGWMKTFRDKVKVATELVAAEQVKREEARRAAEEEAHGR